MAKGVIDTLLIKEYPQYLMPGCQCSLDETQGVKSGNGRIRTGIDLYSKFHEKVK